MSEGRSGTRQRVPVRHIAAVVTGNALEFYDFLTYAFFAVYIGRTFFPNPDDPTLSLLASLATFGVGFVTRPLGAYVIGGIGDRIGRKPAMILSFTLMGVAVTGLVLTPSFAAIGIAAPILVIFFRMLQGFALGGEVGPSTAFLVEIAPPNRRGFYVSFQYWTQDLAVMVSGLVGFGLAQVLSEAEIEDFGWRIALGLGVLIVPVGLWLRRSLPETFHGANVKERPAMRPLVGVAIVGLFLLAAGTIGAYTTSYMTTYALDTLHMPADVAFLATVVTGLAGVVFDLAFGLMSDRFGRKWTMIVPAVLLLLLAYPAFAIIDAYRTDWALLGATAMVSVLAVAWSVPMIVWLTESIPAAVRSRSLALIYAVSIALFGGTTQFTLKLLIDNVGPLAPAYYWMAAMAVAVLMMGFVRETAPRIVGRP